MAENVASKDWVKAELARRLALALRDKGWTQADLVRAAKAHAPEGKTIEAYDVSNYIRERAEPSDYKVTAIAAALGLEPEDLLPKRSKRDPAPPIATAEMKTTEDGNVWLRVNQAVDFDTALQIMKLIKTGSATVSESAPLSAAEVEAIPGEKGQPIGPQKRALDLDE